MSVAVAQAMRYAGCPNRRSLGVSDVFPRKFAWYCVKQLHWIGSIREWHSLVVILQHSFAAAPFNTSVVASVVHLTVALSATEVV